MSSEESSAARRRTICWRWPSAAFGSVWILIWYAPFEAFEHDAALFTNAPENSGKMYQLSVTGPLDDLRRRILPRQRAPAR